MKKYYTTTEYKIWHTSRNRKIQEKKRTRPGKLQRKASNVYYKSYPGLEGLRPTVYAPSDFRLTENPEECIEFFRDLRSDTYLGNVKNRRVVMMSFKFINQIDYGTISILTAINDDFRTKGITLWSDFPENEDCKKYIEESGYLDRLFNSRGQRFPSTEKSDFIFFEKGSGVLSYEDNVKLSVAVKNVVKHLTGEEKYCLPLRTIILEVCGNSIEWSGTDSQQWLLGIKYYEDKVTFTVTDVGKGILETLHRKFRTVLVETFSKTADEILLGAFDKKYGSSSQEVNRNKGLPSIKVNFEQGIINALKVITNNVILDFQNGSRSKTFPKKAARFKGTFYQWEMTSECINKLLN